MIDLDVLFIRVYIVKNDVADVLFIEERGGITGAFFHENIEELIGYAFIVVVFVDDIIEDLLDHFD